jgi:hypothetical protein
MSTKTKAAKPRNRRPSMYLVMLECTWDDVPVRFCTSKDDAVKCAKELDVDSVHESAGKFLSRDLTEPLTVSVIRFNAAGFPKGHWIIRHLDEEDGE